VGPEWVAVEAEAPAAMVEMYRDVLHQHGIPALVEQLGVGRGALGGVPTDVRLLVPAGSAAAARALLGREDDELGEGPDDEVMSERTRDRGER
jgi:Putative prokaryotic signal transducing protein